MKFRASRRRRCKPETVNANSKMSIFAEKECHFSPDSIQVYTVLNNQTTCRFEARQALSYQLVLGLTGENDRYNYSKTVHVYPPFFDITCSAKNYKIAPALTFGQPLELVRQTVLKMCFFELLNELMAVDIVSGKSVLCRHKA